MRVHNPIAKETEKNTTEAGTSNDAGAIMDSTLSLEKAVTTGAWTRFRSHTFILSSHLGATGFAVFSIVLFGITLAAVSNPLLFAEILRVFLSN